MKHVLINQTPVFMARETPRERIAILLGMIGPDIITVRHWYLVPNEETGPDRFAFSGRWFRNAHRTGVCFGLDVVGVAHTHPRDYDPQPSDLDIEGFQSMPASYVGLVLHPSGSAWCYDKAGNVWEAERDETEPDGKVLRQTGRRTRRVPT
jgi:proteasome lid subunit RPN8/RPN11